MRVNVYDEEFPNHVALTEPRLDAKKRKYTGVRFYLATPGAEHDQLDRTRQTPSVTFWLKDPDAVTEMSHAEKFITLLLRAVKLLEDKQREQR